MKNKILAKYPKSEFATTRSKTIYIADFTKRTANIRGVEIHEDSPLDPNNATMVMPCLVISNPRCISIECNIFNDKQFIDKSHNQLKHGECCFFPTKNDGRSWLSVVEIKDCIPGKISEYKQNIIDKMDSMVNIFRNILHIPNTLYFIVSFPRKKTALNDALFYDYPDLKKYKKAFLKVTNNVTITDTHEIDMK